MQWKKVTIPNSNGDLNLCKSAPKDGENTEIIFFIAVTYMARILHGLEQYMQSWVLHETTIIQVDLSLREPHSHIQLLDIKSKPQIS